MPGLPTITRYELPRLDDLPENTAGWTVDPRRAVLLIHDMQRYFLAALPEPLRMQLVTNVAQLRRRLVTNGVPVAYTAQPGRMATADRGLLRDFWGPGMRSAAEDRTIVDQLAPGDDDWIITKRRYSAFHASDLLARMRAAGRDQLVVCGVYAHVGVLITAVDAFSHDIETFVVADGVADFDAESHQLALSYAARRCAVVLRAEDVQP